MRSKYLRALRIFHLIERLWGLQNISNHCAAGTRSPGPRNTHLVNYRNKGRSGRDGDLKKVELVFLALEIRKGGRFLSSSFVPRPRHRFGHNDRPCAYSNNSQDRACCWTCWLDFSTIPPMRTNGHQPIFSAF